MKQQKIASYANNPIEFAPGDKVIQIFPVARPFIGLVVGANKVEGKVYVNWNGRTMQVDPEDIQLAAGVPFFPISRNASIKSDQKKLTKIAEALAEVGKPFKTANFHAKLEKALTEKGIARDEANDISHDYEDGYKKRLNANCLDPVLPMAGELVVVLNDNGTKPGYSGILIDIKNQDAIVDLTSGWSSPSNGSNLLRIPLTSIVPVYTPMREMMANQYPGMPFGESKNKPEEMRVATRAFNLFLNGIKVVDVFNNDNFKAWVQTAATPKGEVIISAIVEKDGQIDPLIERYPIFEQKLSGFNNIQNQTDYKNAVQRISVLVDNCKSSINQYFAKNIIPEYVNKELQREVRQESKIASVIIHDLSKNTKYQISSPDEAKDKLDKSVAEEAFSKKNTITMGKVVAEYIDDNKKDNAKERYNKFFDDKLKEYNVNSPKELNDKEKSEFFNEIDKEWIAKGESGKRYIEGK